MKTTQVRKPQRAKKIDREKVKQLADQGFKPVDIAKHQGVCISTITRYLNSLSETKQAVKHYSNNKADILALSQLKSQSIIDIIQSAWLSNPGKYLLNQDVRLQKEIIVAASGAKTYDHNQERLERNQATSITDYRALVVELNAAEASILKQLHDIEDADIIDESTIDSKAVAIRE